MVKQLVPVYCWYRTTYMSNCTPYHTFSGKRCLTFCAKCLSFTMFSAETGRTKRHCHCSSQPFLCHGLRGRKSVSKGLYSQEAFFMVSTASDITSTIETQFCLLVDQSVSWTWLSQVPNVCGVTVIFATFSKSYPIHVLVGKLLEMKEPTEEDICF